jgi:alpha-L-fucosidase 2
LKKYCLLVIFLVAGLVPATSGMPSVHSWDGVSLAYSKRQIAAGNQTLTAAYKQLLHDADECLKEGPYTVTAKAKTPPSGDKHDYMSMGPYWWPNPDKPDGLPYIRKDGQRNPELKLYEDRANIGKVMGDVETLGLAYYFSDNEQYAAHAGRLLRTWFLDETTRMNPNLNFGQGIPGITDGRAEGLIETSGLITMLDAVSLLRKSKSWTANDNDELKKWMAAFLEWMQTSKIGKDECQAKNNHGTWYDAQSVALALFTGQPEKARQILTGQSIDRIRSQIMADGSQPKELARTNSWGYSNMNLRAFFTLATLAQNVDIDLWHVSNENGIPYIQSALDFLIPAFEDSSLWKHQQIGSFDRGTMNYLLHRASLVYDRRYRANIGQKSRNNLLWPSKEDVFKHGMYMEYPAVDWREALPVGNGDMGAMIYGGVARERILLNHKRYFYNKNHLNREIPDFSKYLPEMRRMMLDGKYDEADAFFMGKIRESGYSASRSGEFQPGFDLDIKQESQDPFVNYSRALDFETGEAFVTWTEGNTNFHRALFVSRADDVAVLKLTASTKNALNMGITIAPHDFSDAFNKNVLVAPDELGLIYEKPAKISGDGYLMLNGVRKDDGQEFGVVARIVCNAKTDVSQQQLQITGADEVTILVKMFYSGTATEQFDVLKKELASVNPSYSDLLKRHTDIHSPVFLRSELNLVTGEPEMITNEKLLSDAYKGTMSNVLAQRMYDYGRYLLISSSAPDGLPAHLQGVWNGLYFPPWNSSFFLNENLQMNYWQALPGNLDDCLLSVFNLLEAGMDDFRTNARQYFGCRGILFPIRMIPDYGLKAGAIPHDVYWTGGAGWMAQFYYDYWLFTRDREFLENRAVPFMKEVALFYEDFAVTGEDGKLITLPSDSPENFPAGRKTQLCISSTIDMAIIKELLTNLVDACTYLKIEKDGIKRWKTMLSKIPDYQINEDGAMKEWLHPDFIDNYHHRHQSHIYPLFPGFEITMENNPRLFEACRVAVEKRLVIGLQSQTGWSLAHIANIYARLNDGQRAWDCLNLLSRSTVGKNLFTYHNDYRYMNISSSSAGWPPFQIDANLGWSAATLEMLVYSNKDMIKILPALPKEWADGSIRGLKCRGNFEVDIEWSNHRLQRLVVKSYSGEPCTLYYNGKSKTFKIPKGQTIILDGDL